MSYRKQISYLELREKGQRTGSAGYARLESLDSDFILTVQITGVPSAEGRLQLYLQWGQEEELLCEVMAEHGKAVCEKRFSKSDRDTRKEILGIRIPVDRNIEILGQFNISCKTTTVRAVKEEPSEDKTTDEGTDQTIERETKIQERCISAWPVKETKNAIHMKDTKWEQLSSIYPHIHPFRDTREFLSVGPEDFVILRERCYQMTHNSFLLHGYYNYRHLLLMKQGTPDQVKYYIGVPGNFYEREKQVARMFGFESFEGVREPAREGDFGYYLISVEL